METGDDIPGEQLRYSSNITPA